MTASFSIGDRVAVRIPVDVLGCGDMLEVRAFMDNGFVLVEELRTGKEHVLELRDLESWER